MKTLNEKRAEKTNLHSLLTGLPYFDVSNADMEKDIGRRCRIRDPKSAAENDLFTISGVQKTHDGILAYRMVGDLDTRKFGMVGRSDEIEFIS